jgi:hypothetical protein
MQSRRNILSANVRAPSVEGLNKRPAVTIEPLAQISQAIGAGVVETRFIECPAAPR